MNKINFSCYFCSSIIFTSIILDTSRILEGSGEKGLNSDEHSYAPFDFIHVGAASVDIPSILIDQLRIGGI
jgi:protein-L-isoaspartate O-methyltransferase